MKKQTLLCCLVIVLLLSSCNFAGVRGSGRIISEARTVSDFNRVNVCCGMHLILKQGTPAALTITADDNILANVESAVSNQALTVRFKQRAGGFSYWPTQPVQVDVTIPIIQGFEVSGGGIAEVDNLESSTLQVILSGGSHATINTLKAETLTLDISGGSRATFATLNGKKVSLQSSGGSQAKIGGGAVTEQTIMTSGGSGYDAGELQSATVRLTMNGGGTATVWAIETLSAQLSGGSTARYYGEPMITQNLSGGSQLKPLGKR